MAQELGEDRGVGKSDLVVERVDSSNMEGLRGQQTSHKINVPWAVASWGNVDGKLCDDLVCSVVSAATWKTILRQLT